MSTELIISIDQIKSLISKLDAEEVNIFDGKKLDVFVESIISSNTVYKLTKSIDIDELLLALSLIDIFYNSQKTNDKMKTIFLSVESNLCIDYFASKMEILEWTNVQ